MSKRFRPKDAWFRLILDRRGSAAIEFAAVFPILAVLLLGGFDIAYQQYAQSVLDGEVMKAGRDSALENASRATRQTNIDTKVRETLNAAFPNATVTFSRRSFSSYGRVANPAEPFIDADGNGLCDNGEVYEDSNRNNVRDTQGSVAGFGEAKDAMVYRVTATYRRVFPMPSLLGWSDDVTLNSTTMLKIQPYTVAAPIPQRACP